MAAYRRLESEFHFWDKMVANGVLSLLWNRDKKILKFDGPSPLQGAGRSGDIFIACFVGLYVCLKDRQANGHLESKTLDANMIFLTWP